MSKNNAWYLSKTTYEKILLLTFLFSVIVDKYFVCWLLKYLPKSYCLDPGLDEVRGISIMHRGRKLLYHIGRYPQSCLKLAICF